MSDRDNSLQDFADFDSDLEADCDSDPEEGSHSQNSRPLEQTIRDEWLIPHAYRGPIVMRQIYIATNLQMKVSDAIAAARCLIMMNGQTLAARHAGQSHLPSSGNANGLSSSPEQREREIDSLFDRIESEERAAANRSPWLAFPGPLADAFEDLPDAEGTGGDEPA